MALTLVPAYGRDYKSKKAVQEAWESGKDFIVADYFSEWDGKPINIHDAAAAGIGTVNIRYKKLRSIAVFKVARKNPCGSRRRRRKPRKNPATNWLLIGGAALVIYLLFFRKKAEAEIPGGYHTLKPGAIPGGWPSQLPDAPPDAWPAPPTNGAMIAPMPTTVNLPGGGSIEATEYMDGFGTYFRVR